MSRKPGLIKSNVSFGKRVGNLLSATTDDRRADVLKYLTTRAKGGPLPNGKRRKSEGYSNPYAGKNSMYKEEHTPLRKIVSLVEARRNEALNEGDVIPFKSKKKAEPPSPGLKVNHIESIYHVGWAHHSQPEKIKYRLRRHGNSWKIHDAKTNKLIGGEFEHKPGQESHMVMKAHAWVQRKLGNGHVIATGEPDYVRPVK